MKMDMGTKGPVRITRMGLPVIVEYKHLLYVSTSIIVLVLAPLGSPIVPGYQEDIRGEIWWVISG